MKKISLLHVFIISLVGLGCCSQNLNSGIRVLKMKNLELMQIISDIHKENYKAYNWDKAVIVINLKKDLMYSHMRISVLYKAEINWLLNNKKITAYGYLENNNIPILVLGKGEDLFKQTNEYISISWLKELSQAPDSKVELPPLNLEPIVWLYKIRDGKFSIEGTGIFPILD